MEHIDQPEPRGQALLAFLAICAIYLALPRNLILGPIWLLPTLIVVLLVPTVVNAGADRIGNPARAHAAFTPADAVPVAALGRITLADQCDRLRALVLAAGWRRADLASQAKQIRQHQLCFSADADPA